MKAHLVGGGIASLAAAAYLIKEGNLLGPNITIYESGSVPGGALDAGGSPDTGYIMRGGRMFEEKYLCTRDLLSFIPTIHDPATSVTQDIVKFYETSSWNNQARLINSHAEIVDAEHFGLSVRDKLNLAELALRPEVTLQSVQISDCFQPSFFNTNFWRMFATIFAFTPSNSAMEMRRYLHRFFHLLPTMATMTAVQRTRFNQYESIVKPVASWLKDLGVHIRTGTRVTNIELKPGDEEIIANRLELTCDGHAEVVKVAEKDLVFVTLGSMVADSSSGSMTAAPELVTSGRDGSWELWEKLSVLRKGFGNPAAFNGNPHETAWESFTVTDREHRFVARVEELSKRRAGRGGLMTLAESNWLITFVLLHHPHFIDQPDNRWVWWGYGLFGDQPGNHVKKPMAECSGAEILEEVLRHLNFDSDIDRILASSTCIPTIMPYGGSVFAPRRSGDRPDVVPQGSKNLAFLGQFAELPEDVVFTVEYSVRTALTAVSSLLNLERVPPPVYKGERDPGLVFRGLKAIQN